VKFTLRITEGWIPLPAEAADALHLHEGATVLLEVVGNAGLLTLPDSAFETKASELKKPVQKPRFR
jgi:antitoxin component of MazEF toxin-antitoxin module